MSERKPTLSEIRNRLRQTEDAEASQHNQAPPQSPPTEYPYPDNYTPGQKTSVSYGDEGSTVEREKSTFQKLSEYEPSGKLLFLHLHWHKMAAGFMFLLPLYMVFAPAGIRLPGTESFENGILRTNPIYALMASAFMAFITYRFLSRIRRTAQNTSKLLNIRTMSTPFKVGAALGFALCIYTFINPLMGDLMVEKPAFEILTPFNFIKLIAFTFIGGRIVEWISRKYMGED